MTYGEIKIESLKLMFVNAQDIISEDWLEVYEDDETFRSYLDNMRGAVNRCFAAIEEKRVLPTRSKTLSVADGNANGAFIRFDLSTLLSDYFDLDRVVRETDDGDYVADCDYRREGDVLVLPVSHKFNKDTNEREPCFDGVTYTAIYKPKIQRIGIGASKDLEISDIPEHIAAYIPYYVKGELFRDDEPNEAAEAMNQFEQRMSEIAERTVSKSNQVTSIYSQTEW